MAVRNLVKARNFLGQKRGFFGEKMSFSGERISFSGSKRSPGSLILDGVTYSDHHIKLFGGQKTDFLTVFWWKNPIFLVYLDLRMSDTNPILRALFPFRVRAEGELGATGT